MSVVSKVKGFLWRHKNKFIASGVLITGSILLTKYAQKRLKEWQETETVEFLERNRKLNHFESLGRTCNQTISNLSMALFELISKTINTDDIIEGLKQNPKNKVELWNNLKVAVFSKTSLVIYSTVMLVVTLKIQLSIIGGYLYKDPSSISTELQEKYLSLCQSFLKESVPKLAELIETEVKKCVASVELSKQMKLSDIEAVCWAIQSSLATHEKSPIENFSSYIFLEELASSDEVYSHLLRDTADFLESEEIKSLTTHCVNRGFILLGDRIAEFYDEKTSTSSTFVNPFDCKKPLAKLLPIISGLVSKQSLPQQFVQQLITSDKLQMLSANIYESLL